MLPMPRGTGRGSILKRGKVYYIKYSVSGRQRWERSGTSTTDAKKLLSRRLAEVDQGLVAFERPVTFTEFIERWKRDYLASAQLKPATLASYASVIDRHLIPYFGEIRIDRITTAIVQRFVAEKTTQVSARGRQLKPKSIQNSIRVLSKVFNTAVDWQMLVRSPLIRIKLPRVERHEMDFLRAEEVQLLLQHAIDQEARCLFLTAVSTGMRQGELLGLQWGDIDFHRSAIKVRRSLSHGTLQTPKTANSNREVRAGKVLLRTLREHQLMTGGRSEFIFSTRTGTPLDPANLVKRVFEPMLVRAGLRRIRFHDLRHTYASIMINEGANLKFVSKQLGHSSIQITLDRYSHLIPERHDASVEHLESLFEIAPDPKAASDIKV